MSAWPSLTWQQAEAMTGQRVDRRRSHHLVLGYVCKVDRWREPCSDCHADYDYDGHGPDRGSGCSACGGHGVRRRHYHSPVRASDLAAWADGVPGPHTQDRESSDRGAG